MNWSLPRDTTNIILAAWILLFAISINPASRADYRDCLYRLKISFPGYNSPEALTNFPALVSLDTSLTGFSYTMFGAPANGGDIRFTAWNSALELDYEIEQWDTNSCVASPTNIPHCVLWLKADAGAVTNATGNVTNWIDQTGSGHGVKQGSTGTPVFVENVLNSKPAVRFDGSNGLDAYGNLGMPSNMPRTIFLVVKPQPNHGNSEVFGSGTTSMIDFGNWGATNAVRLRDGANNGDLFSENGSIPFSGWHIVCAIGDSNGTRVYSDSVQKANVATRHFHYGLVNDYRVGWTGFGGRNYFGDLAELILYTNSLTELEQRQVGWYLTEKYNLQGYNKPGNSYLWVRVPELASNSWIWAYWGNKTATNPPPSTTNGTTWGSGFVGVWHMGQTNAQDSTSNRTYGTSHANMNSTGRIGPGQWFSGSAYVDTGNSALFDFTNNITLSSWVYIDSVIGGDWAGVIDKLQEWQSGYMLGFFPTGNCAMVAYVPASSWRSANATYPSNVWIHLTGTISNGVVTLYTNGILVASNTGGSGLSISQNSYSLMFGKSVNASRYFKGFADELRVENVVRSANWVRACWMNEALNPQFNGYGPVERNIPAGTVMQIR
jgi:hypothetical protein